MPYSTTLPEPNRPYLNGSGSGSGSAIAAGLSGIANILQAGRDAQAARAQEEAQQAANQGVIDVTDEVTALQQQQLNFEQAQRDIFAEAPRFADGVSEEEQEDFRAWEQQVAALQAARQEIGGTRYQTKLLDIHKRFVAQFPQMRETISTITGIDSPTDVPEASADTTILRAMDQLYGAGNWSSRQLAMRLSQVARQEQVRVFGESGLLTGDDIVIQSHVMSQEILGSDTMLRASQSYQQATGDGFLSADELQTFTQELEQQRQIWTAEITNMAMTVRENGESVSSTQLNEALQAVNNAVDARIEALQDRDFMTVFSRWEEAMYNTAALGAGMPPNMIKQVIQSTLQSGNVVSVMELTAMGNDEFRGLMEQMGFAPDEDIITLRRKAVQAVESFLSSVENMNTDLLSDEDRKFHLWYVSQLKGAEPTADALANQEVVELTEHNEVSVPDSLRYLVRQEQDTTDPQVRESITSGVLSAAPYLASTFGQYTQINSDGSLVLEEERGARTVARPGSNSSIAQAWNEVVRLSNTPKYSFLKPVVQSVVQDFQREAQAGRQQELDRLLQLYQSPALDARNKQLLGERIVELGGTLPEPESVTTSQQ